MATTVWICGGWKNETTKPPTRRAEGLSEKGCSYARLTSG